MTNTQIPREAVDAAARALGNHINVDFDVLGPVEQLEAREAAVAALNAAAPLIVAAELEAIATRFEVNASDVAAWAEVQDDHDRLPGEGEAGAYATEAESLRKRIAELKSGVDEPVESAEPRDLIDPIAAALSLLDRFHTPGDRGRTLALISDLRQILAGA